MSVTKVSSPMIEGGTKGADIASAATVVIGTDGSYFDITGTTGISTQFTVDAGRRFTLQFDGAVTITDYAAITLSGAANFTTAAGDILSFVAVAANTVVQTGYSLVDGGSPVAPAAGGAWTLIGTSVASSSASLTQTGLDSTYALYAIAGADLKPATNGVTMFFRVGDSSGIDSGASDYSYYSTNVGTGDAGAPHYATNSNSTDNIRVGHAVGSSAEDATSFLIYLNRGTSYPNISGTYSNQDNASPGNVTGGYTIGQREAVITLDRVQVLCSSGNIASGRFTVYGIKHT